MDIRLYRAKSSIDLHAVIAPQRHNAEVAHRLIIFHPALQVGAMFLNGQLTIEKIIPFIAGFYSHPPLF